MFGKRAPVIFQKKFDFFKSSFCSPFINDSITETPKNLKFKKKPSWA
jgi:hypothetical protein